MKFVPALRQVSGRMHCHVILAAFLALMTCAGATRADVLDEIRHKGRVRVAIAGLMPPFNYDNDRNELTGSDVDTAKLLAQDLGVRLDIVRVANSGRLQILREQRVDLVISALSITPEREREIAFSVPYAHITTVIAAPRPNKLSSMLDLNERTVGVLAASSNMAHIRAHAPQARIVEYPENNKLSNGYIAGEFDIMSAPEAIVDATNRLDQHRPLAIQFVQTEFDVAIGMPKGEKSLRNWINKWVVRRLHDHSLDMIFHKHHGHNLPQELRPTQQP